MNAFADRLFSLLLGWTGTLFNGLWNLVTNNSAGVSGFLRRFWLPMIIILLIFGTVTDYVVWLIRWRPYYAWFSWFRRREGRKRLDVTRHYMESLDRAPLDLPEYQDEQASPDDIPMQDEPVYFHFEPVPEMLPGGISQEEPFLSAGQPDGAQKPYIPSLPWEQARQTLAEDSLAGQSLFQPLQEPLNGALYQPYLPPEEAPVWDETAGPGAQSTLPGKETAPSVRRRRAGSHRQRQQSLFRSIKDTLFTQEDEAGSLDSLPPPVSQEDAFHKPYYPQNYHYRGDPAGNHGQPQEPPRQ